MSSHKTPLSRTAKVLILVGLLTLLALYCGGYLMMRIDHDFVHHATGYTGDSGWVRTDRIRLGEWRYGGLYTTAYYVFAPLRWTEAMYWRHLAPGR